VQPLGERIYLAEGEMAALIREAQGPLNGRTVPVAFGPGGGAWLDPRSRDAQGQYPRWILLRLAVLRGIDLSAEHMTDDERVELVGFAYDNGCAVRVWPLPADGDLCRWELHCTEDAVEIIFVERLGFAVAACAEHALPHAVWAQRQAERVAANRVSLTPDEEPGPECFCPTRPRRKVPYCPTHGTPAERGLEQ
jgi:hypothetical protein